jgi:hypothetical protein
MKGLYPFVLLPLSVLILLAGCTAVGPITRRLHGLRRSCPTVLASQPRVSARGRLRCSGGAGSMSPSWPH